MKRKFLYLLMVLCFYQSFSAIAQTKATDCNFNIDEAINKITKENYSKKDSLLAIELIKPCLINQNPYAQLLMGRLYLNNSLEEDNVKGFKLVKKAAKQDHAIACSDLGDLFKYGIGCEQNYAIAKKWYKKADKLGDTRGTYSLGYMHYKGLGVNQNYKKAIKWFNKSDYPMAKHWLAVSHYFGFGIPQNKTKAIRLLKKQNVENSAIMLDCIEYHIEEKTEVTFSEDYKHVFSAKIKKDEFLEEDLNGKWQGTLAKLDWSENYILQTMPIDLEFKYDDNTIATKYKFTVADTVSEGVAKNEANKLYFEDLVINVQRHYFSATGEQHLKYDILSGDFAIKNYKGTKYLIAFLDTYIFDVGEPGNKFALILSKETTTENGETLSQEVSQALAEQNDKLIKLYPNPFKKELFIAYTLEQPSTVQLEVSGLHNGTTHIVEKVKAQSAGDYIYYFDGSQLNAGINVITLYINGAKHTKTIIKK